MIKSLAVTFTGIIFLNCASSITVTPRLCAFVSLLFYPLLL